MKNTNRNTRKEKKKKRKKKKKKTPFNLLIFKITKKKKKKKKLSATTSLLIPYFICIYFTFQLLLSLHRLWFPQKKYSIYHHLFIEKCTFYREKCSHTPLNFEVVVKPPPKLLIWTIYSTNFIYLPNQ